MEKSKIRVRHYDPELLTLSHLSQFEKSIDIPLTVSEYVFQCTTNILEQTEYFIRLVGNVDISRKKKTWVEFGERK